MASEHPVKPKARRRGKPIEVWVSDEEKELITARAADSGLSRSGYLRAVGLNTPISPRADLDAVRELAKINGDLGRVAGLLKLWLAAKRGEGANPTDVEKLMISFRELQSKALEKMSSIVYARK